MSGVLHAQTQHIFFTNGQTCKVGLPKSFGDFVISPSSRQKLYLTENSCRRHWQDGRWLFWLASGRYLLLTQFTVQSPYNGQSAVAVLGWHTGPRLLSVAIGHIRHISALLASNSWSEQSDGRQESAWQPWFCWRRHRAWPGDQCPMKMCDLLLLDLGDVSSNLRRLSGPRASRWDTTTYWWSASKWDPVLSSGP